MWSGWSSREKAQATRLQRPPAGVDMIDPDVVRSAGTPLQAHARSFARHVITPTVAAAAETYPELSVAEILALCEPALARDLTFELETACREAVSETVRRPRGRSQR
jgi:hypothetical protein